MFDKDYVANKFYGNHIELTESLTFTGEGYSVRVPTGFLSDGTTNQGMHHIIRKFGPSLRASVVHDYLTTKGSLGVTLPTGNLYRPNWPRAADIYGECLKSCGFGRIKIGLIVSGVKLYGKLKRY